MGHGTDLAKRVTVDDCMLVEICTVIQAKYKRENVLSHGKLGRRTK